MKKTISKVNKDLLWLREAWPFYREMWKTKTWARVLWRKMLFLCAWNDFSLSESLWASGALTTYNK